MRVFNEKLDLKLISLVKENNVLYDSSHPQYMDYNAREVAWQRIGDQLQHPAADCKARWVNIRDINRRNLRKSMSYPEKRIRLYKYNAALSFMMPFYKDIEMSQMTDEPADEWGGDQADFTDRNEEDSSDTHPIAVLKVSKFKRKKRKRQAVKEEVPLAVESPQASIDDFDKSEPIDAFLLGIGAILKTFTPYHLNLVKSKIFSVVQEHDLQQIVERENGESRYPDSKSAYKTG